MLFVAIYSDKSKQQLLFFKGTVQGMKTN